MESSLPPTPPTQNTQPTADQQKLVNVDIENENKIIDLYTKYKLCSEYNEEFILNISPKKKD